MAIYPRNSDEIIRQAIQYLGISPTVPTKIMVPIKTGQKRNKIEYTAQTITAYELLRQHVDLQGKATASALRQMLPFVGSMELRNFGLNLTATVVTGREGMSPFDRWIDGRYVTKLDLAMSFECRPSLQAFARIIGTIQPRLYSIATVNNRAEQISGTHTQQQHQQQQQQQQQQRVVGICLSVAKGGLTSYYLSDLVEIDDEVTVFLRPSKFHFTPGKPSLMIGAGSGVGPYLGFLESSMRKQQLPTSGSISITGWYSSSE
jgi:sulfite reductase alpha subunit-like flavoprotein